MLTVAMFVLLWAILPLFTPGKVAAASKFADGEYSVPFTVLKGNSDDESTTIDYMVSPAKVMIQNGKTFAVVTLNTSSWWQYFKVQSANGLVDVEVLSTDTAKDQRVVKFEVRDIEKLLDAKIHIIVTGIPGFSYDNKYDIRFKFTTADIPLAPVAEKPAPKPTETDKTPVTPPQKPADNKPDTVTKTENTRVGAQGGANEKNEKTVPPTVNPEKKVEDPAAEPSTEAPVALDASGATDDATDTAMSVEEPDTEEELAENLEQTTSEVEEVAVGEVKGASQATVQTGLAAILGILVVLLFAGLGLYGIKKRIQPQ